MDKFKIYWKPSMWCLTLHQTAWDYIGLKVAEGTDEVVEGILHNCSVCKRMFFYPTKKLLHPIYKK